MTQAEYDVLGEPKTTDYCLSCGQSPTSFVHIRDHLFADPRWLGARVYELQEAVE